MFKYLTSFFGYKYEPVNQNTSLLNNNTTTNYTQLDNNLKKYNCSFCFNSFNTIDEQKEILNVKIERLNFLIAEIEPWKDEAPEGKPSNQSILNNHIIEKNTYIQVLSEL